MNLEREFKAVRSVGTPIVAVKTQNQPDTIGSLMRTLDAEKPAFRWDTVRGINPLNEAGSAALGPLTSGDFSLEMTRDPVTALELAAQFPDATAFFMVNAHRFIEDPRVSTGIGNLRETYKAAGSTCVVLGPAFTFPAEVMPDVVILEDPLPDDTKLAGVVDFVYEQARQSAGEDAVEKLDTAKKALAVSALRGLSSFGAEQQAFLSLRKNGGAKLGLDMDSLWARKIEAINAMPGLTMDYSSKKPGGIAGLTALMGFLDRLFRPDNPDRPGAVLHIDEIDKALGGFGRTNAGDSSGVTQDQVGQILQFMEDKEWEGMIPVGPPGTGKSLVSKSAAGLYGVPYIRLDLGAMKGSLVGESEQRIRAALDVIDRLAAGKVFVFATCNRLESLPPELKRRFTAGIWYFDLPGDDDRLAIWNLYLKAYRLDKTTKAPSGRADWSAGWTGAEIRTICRTAYRLDIPVEEARAYIVPVVESGKEDIDRLRQLANGRFLDAAKGGKYVTTRTADTKASRALTFAQSTEEGS